MSAAVFVSVGAWGVVYAFVRAHEWYLFACVCVCVCVWQEVERILSCFKLNPYEHLNLTFEATEDDIKKQYRKLSLLVHPDKNAHPRAKDAFAGVCPESRVVSPPPAHGCERCRERPVQRGSDWA